jgi:Flp pilus assembly protein TadG
MRWTQRSTWLLHASRSGGRPGVARGQALVEFALLLSVLLLLLAGATDEATLLNDHLSIVYAARQGARTASVLGRATDTDCAVIGAVHAALANEGSIALTRIVIYKAGADGRPVSSSLQDVYAGNAQCISSNGVATVSPAAISIGWSPSARNTQPFFEDSAGVEIDFTYTFQFQLLGSGSLLGTDYAVMPLEFS